MQMPSPSETKNEPETSDGGPAYPGAFKRIVTLVEPSAMGVADRWRRRYGANGEWMVTAMGPSKATYEALCALGPSPDPTAAAKAIGNDSWTHPACSVTGDRLTVGVQFASEYGDTIILSPDLVLEAARLLAERAKAVR